MENTTPLYNSTNIKAYIEFLDKYYPNIDINSVLDHAGMTSYEVEDEGHWFDQTQVDRFYEMLVQKSGNKEMALEAGRYAPFSTAGNAIVQLTMGFITPSTAYALMGKLYPRVSRSCTIDTKKTGRSKVEIFVKPKPDVKEKLYQCENRIGIFEAVGKLFTGKNAKIEHPSCLHKGDDSCHYIISWEMPASIEWKRIRNRIAVLNLFVCGSLFFTLPGNTSTIYSLLISALLLLFVIFYPEYLENKEQTSDLKIKGDIAGDFLDRINESYNNMLLIQEIGQATANILDTQKLLDHVMEIFEKRLDFDRGLILLANKDRTLLQYTSGYGYQPEFEEFLKDVSFHLDKPKSRGQFVLAFKNQKSFLVNNLNEIEGVISQKSLDFARAVGVKSFICVPIVYEGKSEGVLAVDNLRSKRQLSQSDLNLLMGIAPEIAVCINNAKSYEKIKESEERFKSVGENSPDIIYTLNADGFITYASPALEKRFKYKTHDVLGKHFLDLAKEKESKKITKLFKRASENKETIKDVTITLLDKDGSEIIFNVSGAPNFDSKGKLTGVVGILKDVSELKRNYDTLQSTLQSMINAMSTIVESRDPYTAGHQKRVSEIACAIAEEMNLPLEMITGIRMASVIHDIGKMYIPAEILSKPGVLSELEFNMMKTHPQVGYDILKNIEFTYPIADIVYQHHERMDGSGYPNGISGDDILLEARIIAVADVVEAMSSHRPYRPAIGIDKALEEITNRKGIAYDSDVVDACLKLFKEEKLKVA